MNPNDISDTIINISKAHAYDIVTVHRNELKEQNETLKKAIREIIDEIADMKPSEVLNDPGLMIARIYAICAETLKLKPL